MHQVRSLEQQRFYMAREMEFVEGQARGQAEQWGMEKEEVSGRRKEHARNSASG